MASLDAVDCPARVAATIRAFDSSLGNDLPPVPTDHAPPSDRFVERLRLIAADRFARDDFVRSLAWAVLAGVAGALATMAFRGAINGLVWIETGQVMDLVEAAASLPPLTRVLVPTIGGLIAAVILWAAKRRARRDGVVDDGSGDYMESVVIGDGHVPFGKSLVRSVSSLFSIASGGSIGREGPMVQIAAACASLFARWGRLPAPQRRLVVACGAAAGVTSAYNAPIAGALFIAEIVLGSIAIESLAPLLVSALVANLTTHALSPDVPLYPIGALPATSGAQFAAYGLIGIVSGLCAPLFLGALNRSRAIVARWPGSLIVKMTLGGLIVGVISLRVPDVWGNGYLTINAILGDQWFGYSLLLLLLCKVATTAVTVGSGAIGGAFTPTLFVGAALGALVAQALAALFPDIAPPSAAGAAVAMGAFLAATTQAPLTAILMVLEMTAVYTLTLPLMMACVVAYLVVRILRVPSIYAAAEQRRRRDAEVRDLTTRSIATLVRPSPPTLAADATVPTIVDAFARERFQYLYVVDPDGRYRGAISLHDLRQVLANESEVEQAARRATSLLTPTLQVLSDTMTLEAALTAFAAHRGERLPVVDARGMLVGAAWKTDLLLELQHRLAA